ncbi:MAG: hypothetical protein ACPGO3_00590 [Magnetospiraceae bacterium]
MQGEELLTQLPQEVTLGLSERQKTALARALREAPRRHPVNIRLTLPFFGRRYFLALVAGSESRGPQRRARDRAENPVTTLPNMLFFLGIVTVFYVSALIFFLIHSALIEF